MKFRINRDHFSNGLQQVLNIVGSRVTMPILSNVLIKAEEGQISLTTTNLDLGICCNVKAEVLEKGTVTLPVRKLTSIVKSLPNPDVVVDVSSGYQAKIVSGGSQFRIMGIGADEFPPLPAFEDTRTFTLKQEELGHMLKCVSYAQSKDENRYLLNGVYVTVENGKLSLVATDGRRLSIIEKEVGSAIPSDFQSLIIPDKTVVELERIMGKNEDVRIAFSDRQVAFEVKVAEGDKSNGLVNVIHLVSKIVEGNYPKYRQVIPKETVHRIKIERELFLECVQRASLVVSDKNNSIKLKMSHNLLEISGASAEYGDALESMAIEYEGPDVQVAFNPQFLQDPLKAVVQDAVFFEFKDDLSPGVIKTLESFMCVIMPLRS